jgi:PIN domain nuclease of toxin-antitoxin system
MRILLDTHAFLWAIADDPRLGPLSRELIHSRADDAFSAYGAQLQRADR